MSILDTTALSAVLKTQYTQKKVHLLSYPDNPLWAMLTKSTKFGGSNKVVALRYGAPQGRGAGDAGFAVGLANMSASTYDKFTVTRAKDYAFAQITGEAIEASANDAGALLAGLKSEIDGAIYTCMRSLAIALFRNGGGARGQISATSNVSTQTITLADPSEIVNFEKGMKLRASTADGTSGAQEAGKVTVGAVDRDKGTITVVEASWDTGIGTVAANDFIFQDGDFESTSQLPRGLGAWVPATAPTAGDNFFGVDRSKDTTRLAGLRYTAGAGGPIEEILIDTAARLAREGSKPDVAFLNPLDYANLVKSLSTKVIYDRVQSVDEPEIGFEAVKLMGPKGPVKVVADLNCPKGKGWMLQTNVWAFESLNGAPRILNQDGQDILRDATSDSYIVRVGYYGNLTCEAPGWNAFFSL